MRRGEPCYHVGEGQLVSDELAARVRAVCGRVGQKDALRLLGVGESTLDAARHGARLQKVTVDRLRERLELAERELATREAS